MSHGIVVPDVLKKELYWFGSIIGRPIDQNSKINPITPSGKKIEDEAKEHILPSPTMRPAERIQVYNQQYWWRLLNTMHDIFPLVVRLFGYFDFNQSIAVPYLVKYTPRNWSLNTLGDRLEKWIREDYAGGDKQLLIDAVKVDIAFSNSFLAEELPRLILNQLPNESALEQRLYAQPHIQLFEMDYHLFDFRAALMAHEPEYWFKNEFPPLPKDKRYHFALYRNKNNDISWKEISTGEYHLLSLFQKGATVEEACELLEKQEESIYQEAVENLQSWFTEWTKRGWLSLGR